MSSSPLGRRRGRAATAALSALMLAGGVLGAGTAASADDAAGYLYDFNCGSSATGEGYTPVQPTDAFSAETGYGFDEPLAAGECRDRKGDDPVEKDFVLPTEGTVFRAAVPDGTYTVVVRSGDLIADSRTGVTVGDHVIEPTRVGAGSVAAHVITDVTVTGGQIALEFSGSSQRLNAIEVHAPVGAPSALVAEADAAAPRVSLSWEGADDAASYRVYRQNGAADAEAIGEADGTTYVDDAVRLADAYTYTVVAVSASGLESDPTDPVTVDVVDPDHEAPSAPDGVTAAWAGDDIDVSWDATPGAVAYDLYRGAGFASEDPVLAERLTDTRFTDAGASATSAHGYQVVAVGAGGASERSEIASVEPQTAFARQAERIDRAPVAVAQDDGVYVGWRLLGDDADDDAFHVYRDGERITEEPVTGATNLFDPDGTAESTYRISVDRDVERWATDEFGVWGEDHLDVPIEAPAGGTTPDGVDYTYSANDTSVGDVDGDGEYELIVKWYPSNAKDNSQSGYTGNTYLDAYKIDGTRLWRVDLGVNIRSGAHYTQFQVYDYDGDGSAEMIVKTADGTVDGTGRTIGDAAADHRDDEGRILEGSEFLTVFDGETGAEIDTIDYVPGRGDLGSWGDDYGNRADRFNAATAYLDGEHPSAVFQRGYYTRTVVAAFDFDGESLSERWVFDTTDEQSPENAAYGANGNHNVSIVDVDGDQKDEVILGSAVIDDDGTGLYSTNLGHGDAQVVSDLDPSRPGYEAYMVHEDMGKSKETGSTFRDGATGEILWSTPATEDTGRGTCADIDPRFPGAECWSVGGDNWNSREGTLNAVDGEQISETIPAANHTIWWDADPMREILDHDFDEEIGYGTPTIAKWNAEDETEEEISRAEGTRSNNGTKGNPSLQADLFGDWREEVVTPLEDSSALRIATTTDVTDIRLRTLMADQVYRLGIAWQNTSYNQPPQTSFFLGDGFEQPPAPDAEYTADPVVGEPVEEPNGVVEATASTRCAAGGVVVVVTVSNSGDEAVSIDISTPYGAKTVEVAAGRTASAVFTTRAAEISDTEIEVRTDGGSLTARAAAASCG